MLSLHNFLMGKMYKFLIVVLLSFVMLVPISWGAALRDPTCPPSVKELELTAIIFSSAQQTAIINQKSVRAGEVIDGYRVQKVKPHEVILEGPEGSFILPLLEKLIKSPVAKR